jgi:hypothetical protein
VLALVALAALVVAIGRWERGHRADGQVRGMETVLAQIGPLDSPSLDAFRFLTEFQCLGYRRGRNPVALEACFDAEGRVIEAYDRTGEDPRIWSLRDDPTSSTLRRDRPEVDRLLVRMGVPPRLLREFHRREGA